MTAWHGKLAISFGAYGVGTNEGDHEERYPR